MRLLADEHIARSTVEMLRRRGFEVKWLAEEDLQGIEDQLIYQMAVDEGRIVLTFDSDFSQMAYANPVYPQGIIMLKFRPRNVQECNQRLGQILDTIGSLINKLVVIHRTRVRIRPLPWP